MELRPVPFPGVDFPDVLGLAPLLGVIRPDDLLISFWAYVPCSGGPLADVPEPGDLDLLGVSNMDVFPSRASFECWCRNDLLPTRSSDLPS